MEAESESEILEATYRALCEHGYADLTLQDIADEADRSKASIHYHYESKDQLFAALLDLLYERYSERVAATGGETPTERLYSLLERCLTDAPDSSSREFRTATFEVKAQAPYDDDLRERLAEFDELLVDRLRGILAAGRDAGEFDASIDPSLEAELLATTIQGAHARQVAVDRSPDRLHAATIRYVETQLLADEHAEVPQ